MEGKKETIGTGLFKGMSKSRSFEEIMRRSSSYA